MKNVKSIVQTIVAGAVFLSPSFFYLFMVLVEIISYSSDSLT